MLWQNLGKPAVYSRSHSSEPIRFVTAFPDRCATELLPKPVQSNLEKQYCPQRKSLQCCVCVLLKIASSSGKTSTITTLISLAGAIVCNSKQLLLPGYFLGFLRAPWSGRFSPSYLPPLYPYTEMLTPIVNSEMMSETNSDPASAQGPFQ